MIDVYYWPTPNGHKITIFLEEAKIDYRIMTVNIGAGEQFEKSFLEIAPNNKMPAIVDQYPTDGGKPISVFESGAILLYLAEKTKQYIPNTIRERVLALQWLFWQVAGLGPMAGQNNHFANYASEKIPYAINRYVNETTRLYTVLDIQLKNKNYIAGDYSIADMACYPWIVPHEKQQQNLDDYPHIKRWFMKMQDRPAVQKAYAKGDEIKQPAPLTEAEKNVLFNQDPRRLREGEE